MQPIPLPGQVATAAEKFQLQLAASFVHLNQNIPIIRHLFGKDVSLRGHFRFRLSIILWLLRSHTQGRIWGDPLGEAGGGTNWVKSQKKCPKFGDKIFGFCSLQVSEIA